MRMTGPLPVSLVVITRDAATDIAECLLSAPFCADALVVDSGSGDHTVETARRCGARVVTHTWAGFGPQKQFAVQEARHDWVLCLDADERLSPELRESIVTLFAAGAPASSAAGWRTAKAIRTGPRASSIGAERAGATIRCTSRCWRMDRSAASTAT